MLDYANFGGCQIQVRELLFKSIDRKPTNSPQLINLQFGISESKQETSSQ